MINVIIPTYCPEEYLYDCLFSLANQDIEVNSFFVIIILNGEKEPYYSTIISYIKTLKLSNSKVIYTQDKGVSNARNIGLDMLDEDDYVAFVDDDDKLSFNYLSGLRRLVNKESIILSNEKTFYHNSDVVLNGYLSRKRLVLIKGRNYSLIKYKSFFSVIWGKLIPMHIIGHWRFNTHFVNGEDALFMAAISCNIKTIDLSDNDVIYYRRIRENSASQRKRSFFSKLKNSIQLFFFYMKIYLSSPFKYNFLFFLNRFMAVFKVLVIKEF